MQIGHLGNRFGSLGGGNSNGWVLPGASVDMDFALGLYFGGSLSSLLSTTRAQTVSSYATTSKGLLVPFAANTPRITDQGLLVEQGSTNTALYSRDMTQASWVAVNMTTALNAVGADGVANSATTLTATAGNATILQALTIGSAAETYSVYLKRVSGTGTINISENGGSSWTACTINSTSFTRCSVEATLANPSVGIQIVTNGDVIIADFNQNEALAFPTSPIPTTTTSVTRNLDKVFWTVPGWTNFSVASFFFQSLWQATPTSIGLEGSVVSQNGFTLSNTTGGSVRAGVSQFNTTGNGNNGGTGTAYVQNQVVKMSVGYDGITRANAYANNIALTMTNQTPSQTALASNVLSVGARTGSSLFWNNYIQRLAFSPVRINNAWGQP